MASLESTGRELSFEWSHHRISSIDSRVRVTLQNPVKHSGSERVSNWASLLTLMAVFPAKSTNFSWLVYVKSFCFTITLKI